MSPATLDAAEALAYGEVDAAIERLVAEPLSEWGALSLLSLLVLLALLAVRRLRTGSASESTPCWC